MVGYDVGDDEVTVEYETLRRMVMIVRSLPVRIKAGHSCYNTDAMSQAADLVVHVVPAFVRHRLRLHRGVGFSVLVGCLMVCE